MPHTNSQLAACMLHYRRLPDKSYLMKLGPQQYIDARTHLHVAARYINDCRNPAGHNVIFDKQPELGYAIVTAKCSIATNAELFADYG
eukprot:3276-Heterococcus_DN1.PRE.3